MPHQSVFQNQTTVKNYSADSDSSIHRGSSVNNDSFVNNDPSINNDSSVNSSSPSDSASCIAQEAAAGFQNHTGVYISTQQKYDDLQSSGSSLLMVGLFLAVLFLIDVSRIIRLPMGNGSRILTDSVLMLLSGVCLIGSHASFKHANEMRATIILEEKRRRQIISWCTSTYPALQIDKMIDAAEAGLPDSMEVLSLKRLDMIRSYLVREYHIEDEPYLEDLCEEIFQKTFGL